MPTVNLGVFVLCVQVQYRQLHAFKHCDASNSIRLPPLWECLKIIFEMCLKYTLRFSLWHFRSVLGCSFPKLKRSCSNHCMFPRHGLWENKELHRGEIKSQLLSATITTEILQMVVKKEEEEPPGHLVWSRCCSVCCATSKSGATPLKWVDGVPQIQSTLQGENQTAVICESLLALWFSLCGFLLCFMSCFSVAFLAQAILSQNCKDNFYSGGFCRDPPQQLTIT